MAVGRYGGRALTSIGLAVSFLTALPPDRLTAQCPDGSPPPCRVASAAPRREPPLDQRTWLVLPFENTAGAPEVELVRQASVNLLYQELSRWSDLRVINDDRVADLIRDVPAASQARWGLTTGLGLARRAGAGRLVLGDYLAVGGSAQVAAKVYDVRTGQLVRTVRDRLSGLQSPAGLDSLAATFGRLARSALDVPAPAGTRSSTVGTASLAAYAEYVAGLAQYRYGFADSALPRFRRALALDSTFALPALRLFEMNQPDAARFLDLAQRSELLSPRDRAMVSAYRAVVRGEWDRVCEVGDQLLGRDSTDAEAWFMKGACEEDQLISEGPSGPRFVRSLNRAIVFYLRALELDPSQPIVFYRLVTILENTGTTRTGCTAHTNPCPPERQSLFAVTVRGDSLVFTPIPRPVAGTRAAPRTPEMATLMRWRWERRRQFLSRFVQANPRSWPAHASYARALLQLGDLTGAAREYDAASYAVHLPGDRRLYYRDRIELELRRERPQVARAYLDSMLADTTSASQPQYATAFGRFSRDLNVVPDSVRVAVNAARAAWTPVFAGLAPPALDSIEARYARVIWPRTPIQAASILRISTVAAFHVRRAGPALDSSEAEHPLVRFQAFFARGDTARARALLVQVTNEIGALPPEWPFDDAQWIIGAESWLELGDSSRALVLMQDWVRRGPAFHLNASSLLEQAVGLTSSSRLIPRAWLLFADLSRAAGRPDDARRGYHMVLGMWEGGEAPVQPTVARVRAALTALGN